MIAFAHIEVGTKVAAAQTQWTVDGDLVIVTRQVADLPVTCRFCLESLCDYLKRIIRFVNVPR